MLELEIIKPILGTLAGLPSYAIFVICSQTLMIVYLLKKNVNSEKRNSMLTDAFLRQIAQDSAARSLLTEGYYKKLMMTFKTVLETLSGEQLQSLEELAKNFDSDWQVRSEDIIPDHEE